MTSLTEKPTISQRDTARRKPGPGAGGERAESIKAGDRITPAEERRHAAPRRALRPLPPDPRRVRPRSPQSPYPAGQSARRAAGDDAGGAAAAAVLVAGVRRYRHFDA